MAALERLAARRDEGQIEVLRLTELLEGLQPAGQS
jgi:hypothetical protein